MINWFDILKDLAPLFVLLATIAALLSVRQTSKNVKAQILSSIHSEYASPEMHTCLKKVRAYKSDWDIAFELSFKDGDNSPTHTYDDVDDSRRIISHYYYKIAMMRQSRIISRSFLKKLISGDQVEILFEIIEPLDRAKNPNYDRKHYNMYRKYYSKESEKWSRDYLVKIGAKRANKQILEQSNSNKS